MERHIVANRGWCPHCGGDLHSMHRHHFVTCCCGKSSLDGGLDYIRVVGDTITNTLFEDDVFELVREWFQRGGYGKDGNGEFRYTKLSRMTDSYLEALLSYSGCPEWQKALVKKEQYYRTFHGFCIENGIEIFGNSN